MNKAQLIEHIARDSDMSKAEAARALNAILKGIQSTLAIGDPVVLLGFGTFTVSQHGARAGRNPHNGQRLIIKARKRVHFKAGKYLKTVVNELERPWLESFPLQESLNTAVNSQ